MEMMHDHVIRPRVTMFASGLNHPDYRGVMVAAVPRFIAPTTAFAVETDSTQTRTLHAQESPRRR